MEFKKTSRVEYIHLVATFAKETVMTQLTPPVAVSTKMKLKQNVLVLVAVL